MNYSMMIGTRYDKVFQVVRFNRTGKYLEFCYAPHSNVKMCLTSDLHFWMGLI